VKHDAEDAIARLLRTRAEPDAPIGPCLDAEVLAAWFDGTLGAAQRTEAEAHASTCARCQALLATMAQTEPVGAPPRRTVSLIRWFAPALAAAAAVLVWMNVAGRRADVRAVLAPAVPNSAQAQVQTRTPQPALNEPSAPAAKPLEKRASSPAAAVSANEAKPAPGKTKQAEAAAAPIASANAQLKDEATGSRSRDELVASSEPPLVVRSPDGTVWRIAHDGTVDRSDDDGSTWHEQALGSSAHLLAGASPSPNVVWFAGARGSVVVTMDGTSWQWRPLPEPVDVTGIAAVDAQTATVTSRDGRRFVTHDGGLTWVPAAVQENPAAPF
jgi:hypothetical protein